jgi:CelD/BcsL family acetyltransferase involved in cellulose biosynthesis
MANSDLKLLHFRTSAELRAAAADWDDLWQRSTTTLPTARAALVSHWVERLARERAFHAIAVRENGQLVAAMPLVETRLKGVLKAARLPCNEWSWAGDLLLDPDASTEALDRLVNGILGLSLSILWFDGVPVSQPHWQRFLAALAERGIAYARRPRFQIGLVDLAQDWAAYQAAWSGNFRRQMRKMTRRAEELGGVSLSVHRPSDPAELKRLLQLGFEVEDRSWKGRDGTSVLKSPQMLEYLCEQAALLAELGHLELYLLEFENKPIAFEYGMSAKHTYFSPKVGYDDSYSHLSPGQLLRLKMMERFFADSTCDTWDFLGPLVEATERWTTSAYWIERLVVATGGISSRLALRTYRDWLPAAKRLRERWTKAIKPQPAGLPAAATATANQTGSPGVPYRAI